MSRKTIILLLVFMFCAGVAATIRKPDAQRVKADQVPQRADVPDVPGVSVREVHSGDGTKKIMLRTDTLGDTSTYTFSVDGQTIYTKTLGIGSTMFLPANAWDPTDTYVFIGEQSSAVPDYFVMKGAGGPVIDVGAVWKEKKIPYIIREATGWASGTLLVIYTSKDDGTRGPSFWFEIPSTAIIQLWN